MRPFDFVRNHHNIGYLNTRVSTMSESIVHHTVADAIQKLRTPASLLVAFSGGLDSTVLLHALHALKEQENISFLGTAHVHHGISSHADDWLTFCEDFCAARDIPFFHRRVSLANSTQSSLEEEARDARYQALLEMARESNASYVVLGQHQDDQVESLMLQLLRGSGPHGLAAMAQSQPLSRSGVSAMIWRPLLHIPRSELVRYADEYELQWVDDDSNINIEFKRNFLRHKIFPVLEEAFPGYRKTLARAALLQADTVALLDQYLLPQIQKSITPTFPIACKDFAQLPENLAQFVLRQAIHRAGLRASNYRHLSEMTKQLQNARDDARIELRLGQYRLGVHKGNIDLYRPVAPYRMRWQQENVMCLPHGRLLFFHTQTPGLNRDLLENAEDVIITSRVDQRETLQCEHRPRRLLSDLFREADVPHWARATWPRIYIDGELAVVPEIGIVEKFHSEANGVTIRFIPER